MSNLAVQVQGLSKRYRIGAAVQPHDSLREALMSAVRMPFQNLRRLRDLTRFEEREMADVVWALKDISFDVKVGEAIGIVGRNGAGKSTLLKILSRIARPTEGRAIVSGNVGSLLEVGTGFHPELTGRENVFLNGSILGMDRQYIGRRFDEIVEFAGIDRYIDTPVKRYSSGMYLRLAFAVAAHLEPEILIVDEVLAVGDVEFQKKCLGKMSEVAGEGRTVLFVSHNMQAVANLTSRCILLRGGRCHYDGPTPQAIKQYFSEATEGAVPGSYVAHARTSPNQLLSAQVHTSDEGGLHGWGKPIRFEFEVEVSEPQDTLCFAFQVVNEQQQPICHFWLFDAQPYRKAPGVYRLVCDVPNFRLYMGSYTLTTWFADRRGNTLYETLSSICPFDVTMQGIPRDNYEWVAGTCAYIEDATWAPAQRIPATPISARAAG